LLDKYADVPMSLADASLVRMTEIAAANPPAVYRPRHPEKTAFYRLFQDHFDSYVRAYLESLESQARYIARPAMAMDALQQQPDGILAMETPPNPRSGATLIVLDPLGWIHRISAHIPNPGQHTRRSYGAYSNRARGTAPAAQGKSDRPAQARPGGDDSEFTREARRTWARLSRKILEVDPLLCSCGAEMKIVSILTQPRIVDRILRHLRSHLCRARDPFEPRAPPRAEAVITQ
jgi:hypothetical protein